jgi:signal transduction histidine kinase
MAANFVSNFSLWRHAESVSVSSGWIQRSYETIQELDLVSTDLMISHEGQKSPLAAPEVTQSLSEHISRLRVLMADSPAQVQRLADFQKLLQGFRVSDILEARKLMRLLRDEEDRTLVLRLKNSASATIKARREIIFGSVLDAFLLFCAIAIYWLEHRRWKQTEMALVTTLEVSRSTNQRLENLNAFKSKLFRSTVHDLKNPLGSIGGFADLIQTDIANAESVLQLSKHIQRIVQETLKLVQSLLHTSSMELGAIELHLQSFNAQDEIKNVCEQMQALAYRKNQRVRFRALSGAITLRGDVERFREIMQNLIGNAIKFSPPGASVWIRSYCNEAVAKIEVEDEGPGFSPEDKQKAFRRFQKLSATPTGGETSNGLGLSIVKELIELHQGFVRIETPASGRGACFVVELPLARAEK